MSKLLANKWKTPDGVILWSKHRHDCQTHQSKDGTYFMVDGGNEYIRTSNRQLMENMCVYDDGTFHTQRKYVLWGSRFDKNGKELKEIVYKPIKDLNTGHLYAILEHHNVKITKNNSVFRLIEEEISYRENLILTKNMYCGIIKKAKL